MSERERNFEKQIVFILIIFIGLFLFLGLVGLLIE
jgi:hypothetical protein